MEAACASETPHHRLQRQGVTAQHQQHYDTDRKSKFERDAFSVRDSGWKTTAAVHTDGQTEMRAGLQFNADNV
jgi:hypothetical protein